MSFVTGTIFSVPVINAAEFFFPLLNNQPPTSGFAPWSGPSLLVTMIGYDGTADKATRPFLTEQTSTTEGGQFKLNEYKPSQNVSFVYLMVSSPLPNNHWTHIYRSSIFAYPRAQKGNLNIYILEAAELGVSAGFVSKALKGAAASLPGTIHLATNTQGIGVDTSAKGANIQFTIGLVGASSPNLAVYADLDLANWNVTVGFPADCGTNAHTIVQDIRNSLSSQDSALSSDIDQMVLQFLDNQLTSSLGPVLYWLVSVSLSGFQFVPHSWLATNTTDTTTVIKVSPSIGYPRSWGVGEQ